MAQNKFLHLKNPPKVAQTFKKKRGFKKEEEKEEVPLPKTIHPAQRRQLRQSYRAFNKDKKLRAEQRTIELPITFDLIKIHFFTVFNFDLQKKFYQKYSFHTIELTDFNKTVLFEVGDIKGIEAFQKDLIDLINADENESYEKKPYNLLVLIMKFDFYGTQERILDLPTVSNILSLLSSVKGNPQHKALLNFFNRKSIRFDQSIPGIIEINDFSENDIMKIAQNFDIVKAITSSRTLIRRPGVFGQPVHDYGFAIIVPENIETICIIDTGVEQIEPLRSLITNVQYDHTGNDLAILDQSGHGTAVAAMAVLGDDFFIEPKEQYNAKAKIAIIKAIEQDNDTLKIPDIIRDIRDAKRVHGIRLFNMSMNLVLAKAYNEHFSDFAYELDKLAHEEDILIFLTTGNINSEALQELLNEHHVSHQYPNFFYCLDTNSDIHRCHTTNLCVPAESMNNLTIGALAGNFENENSGITPDKSYPALYTRKFHYDFNQMVNGYPLKNNQKNKHLNKPDLIFEGGDLFEPEAMLQILRSPMRDSERFYGRDCGTSLAAPLVASYAAEILNSYPTLRMQSVKAILINSANLPSGENPPAFKPFKEYPLLKKLSGFGRPNKDQLTFTDDDTITFVIEDKLDLSNNILKVIPLKIPDFVAQSQNKLEIKATLCFSFLPFKESQLNYLPLYLSFGLFKNVDVDFMAGNDKTEYAIKNGVSWSSDFFGIENRLFSNCQQLHFNLQSHDLNNVNQEVCVAVRCSIKNEIPESIKRYYHENQHAFSLVLTIKELPVNNKGGGLYAGIVAENRVENIGILEVDGDLEAEA